MDDFVTYVLRPGVLVVALSTSIIVLLIRRIVETARPDLKRLAGEMAPAAMYGSKAALWWNEVALHIIPVVLAGSVGLVHSTFLNGPIDRRSAAVMFNCGIGWFSGTIYKAFKKALGSRLGVAADSEPPSR